MRNGKAIQVQGLHKRFGDLHAVRGVSFEVGQGEIFSLLGPNGAGKSTTISMLACLLRPTHGDACVMGHSVMHAPQAAKGCLGVVPQDVALYPDLSARENLSFWGQMYGLRGGALDHRITQVLEVIGLADRQKDCVGTFSGGMKRRVNIGAALLHRPQVIILDEPTVGIDPQSRRHILDSVKALNREGATVLYTTHYMEEAQELSDRIAIMDRGEIVALGRHVDLIKRVGEVDRLEITLTDQAASVAEQWRHIGGVRGMSTENGSVTLLAEDSHHVLPRLFETAAQAGVRLASLSIHEPNLEAVFLQLTGRALRD